jgi:hypothetical protein
MNLRMLVALVALAILSGHGVGTAHAAPPAGTWSGWGTVIPAQGGQQIFDAQPMCVETNANRIDCFQPAQPSQSGFAAIARASHDYVNWTSWTSWAPTASTLQSPPSVSRPSCFGDPANIVHCLAVIAPNPSANPNDNRLHFRSLLPSGAQSWWSDLGRPTDPTPGRPATTLVLSGPVCTRNAADLSCLVVAAAPGNIGQGGGLVNTLLEKTTSGSIWQNDWLAAGVFNDIDSFGCAVNAQRQIDCLVSAFVATSATSRDATLFHVTKSRGSWGPAQEVPNVRGLRVTDLSCFSNAAGFGCFGLTDLGTGFRNPAVWKAPSPTNPAWDYELIGNKTTGSPVASSGRDVLDLDCIAITGVSSFECYALLPKGVVAQYWRENGAEVDWGDLATRGGLTGTPSNIQCLATRNGSRRDCFVTNGSGMQHAWIEQRTLRPIRLPKPANEPFDPNRPVRPGP